MILSLSVNNIVLVEKLQITINSGLSALTGETGAGKSILLDAIGLVIGGRGDSSLVRKGTDKSIITAEIEINSTHPAWDILNDLDIDAQNNEPIILKRSMTAEGKSKCYVNGQPINVKDLRGLGETLVDVQGQFEQHGLLSTATHMNTLDNYAKLFSLKTEIKSAYENWSDIQKKYDIAINEYEKIKADSEYILHCLDELEKCDLQENEETELNEQKDKLKNADKLLNAYNEVYDLLNGDNGSYDSIAKSQRNIEKISDIAGTEIETALENLETASSEVLNAISIIKDQADIIQSSANDLQTIEDRLFMLSDLAKKHRTTIDGLIPKRDEFRIQAELLNDDTGGIAKLESQLKSAQSKYIEIAQSISNTRNEKSIELAQKINTEMPNLALSGAEFKVDIETNIPENLNEASPTGIDKVRFMARTNVGSDFAPIHKSASGGELSRLLLGLNLALAETNTATTLLFDEVDAGIGGAAAHTIGVRLKELAKTHQVIVITHSPQVAGLSDNHFFVSKSAVDNSTYSEIKSLSTDERVNEIARMLSGDTISEESKANAKSLMGL